MKRITCSLLLITVAGLISGCASVQRGTPSTGSQINVNLDREDYTILGTTKGTSTVQSYLGGLVQIIDNDKVVVLGIKGFEDQYAYYRAPQPTLLSKIFGGAGRITPEDRAYYKALAATPDADVVMHKSMTKQQSIIPVFRTETTVTFTGKALKYKVD